MRKAKKLLSLLLALSMVVGMVCTSALAAEEEEPGSTESCEHVWGEWEETTPAACEEDGEETRTCTECGETETRTIDMLGHDPDEGVEQENGVLYTCQREGCNFSQLVTNEDKEVIPEEAETEAEKLQAVINAAEDGVETTITMTANVEDITTAITVPAGKVIVLDMAGHKITVSTDFSGRAIENKGDLTVQGNGTVDASNSTNGYGAINNTGTLTIENGTFRGNSETNTGNIRNAGNDAVLVINDGTFDTSSTAVLNYDGLATLNGGTYTTHDHNCSTCGNNWAYLIRTWTDGNDGTYPRLYVNGGTYTGTQGALSTSVGYLEVNGGTFKTVDCKEDHGAIFYPIYAAGEYGEVKCVINGGTFENTGTRTAVYLGNDNTNGDGGINADALSHVYGGTFIAPENVPALSVSPDTAKASVIHGGSYTLLTEAVRSYVDPAKVAVDDSGKTVVRARTAEDEDTVAEVDGKYYASLQAAIDNCPEDGKVTMLANYKKGPAINVTDSQKLTLDLNGKTLAPVPNEGKNFAYGIILKDSADLTVVDNGSTKGSIAPEGLYVYGIMVYGDANLTVDGAVIDGTNVSENGAGSGIATHGNDTHVNSIITVKGDSVVKGSSIGIYDPGSGTLKLEGGEISGLTGVEVRKGELSIPKNSTAVITGDYTYNEVYYGFSAYNNGSGQSTFGAGVAVSPYTEVKVTIAGGKIEGYYPLFEQYLGASGTGTATISVTGGEFSAFTKDAIPDPYRGGKNSGYNIQSVGYTAPAAVKSVDNKNFISGGTFSSDVKEYVVTGSTTQAKQDESGKWTIVPATSDEYVATVGSRSYTTLREAIDAAKPGDTVTLLTDTAESVTIAQNQNITLDLNGKTLSGTMEKKNAHKNAQDNADYYAMQNVITNYGTLTIMDSTWKGVDANGNVIGEGPVGTIMGGTDNGTTKYVSWYKDGQPQYTYPGRSGIAIVNEENATCTIKSGLIKRGDDGTFGNYTVQNKGHMIVEGGLITNNSNVSNLVINFTKKKNAENKDSYINGCKAVMDIKGGMLHQNNMSVLKNDPGGELNISGDAALVWRVANENNYATNFYGTVNMTGGTIRTNGVIPLFSWKEGETEFPAVFNISGNAHLECNALESNNGVMGGYNNAYVTQSTVPTINISGNPTITVNKLQTVCSIDNQMTTVANRTWATINVSGGTFSTPVDGQYCAAGFLPISNSNGTYGVSNANLVLTPSVTSMTGSGTVTLRTTFAGSAVNATVTGDNGVTVTGSNGTYTVSLPNTTATYTFTAAFSGKTATCTVTVTRYTSSGGGGSYRPSRPSGGGGNSGGGDVEIDDPNVPLAQLPLPFTDVKDDDWFREAVAYAYSNSLIVGITPVTFEPDTQCDRAMVATILHRIEKTPEITFAGVFTDVAEGQWYSNGVEWCAGNSIVSGYGDSLFGPQDKVTREQLASMLYRYAQYKGYDVSAKGDLSRYPDCGVVSDWAEEALSWAVGNGIVSGSDGLLQPGNHATRAQFASILQRFDEKFSK